MAHKVRFRSDGRAGMDAEGIGAISQSEYDEAARTVESLRTGTN